jgi:hypothetical protein
VRSMPATTSVAVDLAVKGVTSRMVVMVRNLHAGCGGCENQWSGGPPRGPTRKRTDV